MTDLMRPPGPGEELTGRMEAGGKTYYLKKPKAQKPTPVVSQLRKRRDWEKFQFEKYGNPWEDEKRMSGKINEHTRSGTKRLFEYVFGDNFRYEDRQHLGKKEQDIWKNAILKFRRNTEKRMQADIARRKLDHKSRMKTYDAYVKEFFGGTPVKVVGPQGKARYMPPRMAMGMEAAGTTQPSVAREKFERGKEEDVLYNTLYEKGLVDVDEKGNIALGEYDPEKYKSLVAEAKRLGYEPVSRHTEAKKRWGPDIKESYNVVDFRKTGESNAKKRKLGETIDEYLERVGR